MTHKLLVVDDEDASREEMVEYLSENGYDCVEASGSSAALEIIRQDRGVAIVVSDLKMPGQDGLELLSAAKAEADRDLEVILVTGYGGTKEAIDALRLGAQDYLEKPVDLRRLFHVIQRTDELLNLRRSQRLSQESLEAEVEAKTARVRLLTMNLEDAYTEALACLAIAAEFKDPETGNHIKRIGAYARLIAAELGWPEQRQWQIQLAAPLHDVGKIGTPDNILLKRGKLTPEEVVVMKQHAEIGHRVLSGSHDAVMKCAANIAYGHHERWDGNGYPRGLRGTEIPIEARITTLGDIYDALRSERPYKPAFDHEKAASIILHGDGRTMPEHFDPELLEIFRRNPDKFADIFDSLSD